MCVRSRRRSRWTSRAHRDRCSRSRRTSSRRTVRGRTGAPSRSCRPAASRPGSRQTSAAISSTTTCCAGAGNLRGAIAGHRALRDHTVEYRAVRARDRDRSIRPRLCRRDVRDRAPRASLRQRAARARVRGRLPSKLGDVMVYVSADAGNRKGIRGNTEEATIGLGVRLALGAAR